MDGPNASELSGQLNSARLCLKRSSSFAIPCCRSLASTVLARSRQSRIARATAVLRLAVHVNQYYFYVLDRDFGLCFIKFSSYVPFTVRVWLNGHEWAKRQLAHQGIGYEALDNGFFACDDAETLQTICDSISSGHIETFFRKWLRRPGGGPERPKSASLSRFARSKSPR